MNIKVFAYATCATAVIFLVCIILLPVLEWNLEAIKNTTSIFASVFTCISVIWIASGIYLSQQNLKQHSIEIKDTRAELVKHTIALTHVSNSLQIDSFMRLYEQACLEMDKIENNIVARLFNEGKIEENIRLHAIEGAHKKLLSELHKSVNLDIKALASKYCKIYELCNELILEHPNNSFLKDVFFSRSDITKNNTLISSVLS